MSISFETKLKENQAVCTFDNAPFIEKVDVEVRSARRRESLFEERLGVVELERLSGIGDSDDPVTEFQQPEHQRSSEESSAA